MPRSRKKKKSPKRVLALPDLEQAKSAVLNTLTSKRGQRTYDRAITEFVEWYCSEPRSDQQGWSYSHGSDSSLGEESRGFLDRIGVNYDRSSALALSVPIVA